jgi:hypothetical protein
MPFQEERPEGGRTIDRGRRTSAHQSPLAPPPDERPPPKGDPPEDPGPEAELRPPKIALRRAPMIMKHVNWITAPRIVNTKEPRPLDGFWP